MTSVDTGPLLLEGHDEESVQKAVTESEFLLRVAQAWGLQISKTWREGAGLWTLDVDGEVLMTDAGRTDWLLSRVRLAGETAQRRYRLERRLPLGRWELVGSEPLLR